MRVAVSDPFQTCTGKNMATGKEKDQSLAYAAHRHGQRTCYLLSKVAHFAQVPRMETRHAEKSANAYTTVAGAS